MIFAGENTKKVVRGIAYFAYCDTIGNQKCFRDDARKEKNHYRLTTINRKIEVAVIISNPGDATGADENGRKGKPPKEQTGCGKFLGIRRRSV